MANKNSMRLKRAMRKELRSGNKESISTSTRKNVEMVVIKTTDESGKVTGTMTRFISLNKDRAQFKRKFPKSNN